MARSRFHRHAARLALLAILLLATLPTLGRLFQAGTPAPPLLTAAMCTTPGGAARTALDWLAAGEQAPAQPDHVHQDCDYCPLLSALVFAAALLAGWFQSIRALVLGIDLPPPRLARHPCGLGSRGPPLAA